MNIFIHELKTYRKTTIIWTCSLVAVVILFLSMYPAFSKNVADLKQALNNMPPAVVKVFGLNTESFLSLLGFYSFTFIYLTLCGAIQAMNLGISILSKEESGRTADFLLTKPVTRSQVMTGKLSAVFTALVLTNVTYTAAARIMASAVTSETYSVKAFYMISITLLFVQLIFASLGVFVSMVIPRLKSVTSISLGTVFVFFIISMFGSVIGDKAYRYLTPFKYFDTAYIIKHAAYEKSFIMLAIAVVVAAIVTSYLIYSQKDIPAA
jgi:ABC-2 type transport system permease protein